MSQCKTFVSWPCTGKLIYTAHFANVYTPVSVHVYVFCVRVCYSVCAYHMIAHLYSMPIVILILLMWCSVYIGRTCQSDGQFMVCYTVYTYICSTNSVYTDIFMHVAIYMPPYSYTSLSAGVSCGEPGVLILPFQFHLVFTYMLQCD